MRVQVEVEGEVEGEGGRGAGAVVRGEGVGVGSTCATRCESEPSIVSIILTEAASASGTPTEYSPMRA